MEDFGGKSLKQILGLGKFNIEDGLMISSELLNL